MLDNVKGAVIMGTTRNGARTYLTVIKYACKLSHMPGFRGGLGRILGPAQAEAIYDLWTPLCTLFELTMSLDDHFNQIDATSPNFVGGEDLTIIV
jgi:hypothetical protein